MEFRAHKKEDKNGYFIQGVAFSNGDDHSVGFILEQRYFPSGKSNTFTLGSEANKLGKDVFDLFNEIFKRYGELKEVKKVKFWVSTLAGSSFDVSLLAEWRVEESVWKDLVREVEKAVGV